MTDNNLKEMVQSAIDLYNDNNDCAVPSQTFIQDILAIFNVYNVRQCQLCGMLIYNGLFYEPDRAYFCSEECFKTWEGVTDDELDILYCSGDLVEKDAFEEEK